MAEDVAWTQRGQEAAVALRLRARRWDHETRLNLGAAES